MMRMMLIGMIVGWAGMALADAPNTSQRPVQRGGNAVVQLIELDRSGALAQPRPGTAAERAEGRGGLFSSLRPLFRSRTAEKKGRKQRKLRQKGAVCGDMAIQGEQVGRVKGKLNGCGVEQAVRVRAISGVALSQRAVMDCRTAGALKTWLEASAKPAMARNGGGLKSLRIAAHYACRTRNSRKGARISEHGKGRAIDISGFRLHSGKEISVLQGWNAPMTRKAMRRIHKGACGPFGTVLGPNADKYHRDHFHFDTARYRSGSYCR
ncbi:MAG: extensin family protein [Sulfitobacter sp.]|nr:extensin family protein [Sulfitobacter sp.]